MKKDNWIHKDDGMICNTCMWFVVKTGLAGRCRRHSPTLEGYPVVFNKDWCGDHKLEISQKSIDNG